jgi:hypothetical protein
MALDNGKPLSITTSTLVPIIGISFRAGSPAFWKPAVAVFKKVISGIHSAEE